MRRIVDAVHDHDTKYGIQLWDGGIQSGARVQLTPSGIGGDFQAVGNASEASRLHILTLEEIEGVIRDFGEGARRCMEAGFDFVEIHAGHGYLISAFMTPYFNRRTDHYGGNFENRSRFLLEIMREVKSRVGDRITLGVKLKDASRHPRSGRQKEDRLTPIEAEISAIR